MRSPFPGMDPFLEISGDWRRSSMRGSLMGVRTPSRINCRTITSPESEEQFHILGFPDETEEHRLPDISIFRFSDYLYKRVSLIARSIHLMELDFLVAGSRLPMGRSLRGIYHALVSGADTHPSRTYSIGLSVIRYRPSLFRLWPLTRTFRSISQRCSTAVYQQGRYERSIDYSAAPELPHGAMNRAWARKRALNAEMEAA